MELEDWKKDKGYINLSPQERAKIDALMQAGRKDDAWQLISESRKNVGRDELWGKVGQATVGAADVLTTNASYDVGGRTEDLTRKEDNRQVAQNALNLGMKGLQAGAAFGPIGMGVGAIGGALVGKLKADKANREAQKQINANKFQRHSEVISQQNADRETELKTGKVQYLNEGGFVKGKGDHDDDANRAMLDPGDFVIPAGTTPMARKMVEDFAKAIDANKKKAAPKKGERPVKLSDGELIVL